MNCLPTPKITSEKSKNMYLPPATQKYEQRIKEAKVKQSSQLRRHNLQDLGVETQNYNPGFNAWVNKRNEIDLWRKDVLYALQLETLNNSSSKNFINSNLDPDSSTLTASSTFCSQKDDQKKKVYTDKNVPTPTSEEYCFKIQKSPSIPLFQSNSKSPINGNTVNNESSLYNLYTRHSIDSKMSVVDDDEVFLPIISQHTSLCIGNSTSTLSSTQFIFPKFTDTAKGNQQSRINQKLTPQFIKKPIYLPVCNQNERHEHSKERICENRCDFRDSKNKKNLIYYKVPGRQTNSFIHTKESLATSPKNTLHKSETNAKIILKPTNYPFNNENHSSSSFFRTRSLNIKRSSEMLNQESQEPLLQNTFQNTPYDFRSSAYFPSVTQTRSQKYDNNPFQTQSNNPSPYTCGHSKYIVLKPTFSQENILYPFDQNSTKDSQVMKMSSYNSLKSVGYQIPKVSINEPFTLKFVFKSEPSLWKK